MKKKIIIVLMGFPGSGKTTIANKLQNMFAKKIIIVLFSMGTLSA